MHRRSLSVPTNRAADDTPARLARYTADEGWERMPPYDAGADTPPWRWPAVAALLFLLGLFVYARAHDPVVQGVAGKEAHRASAGLQSTCEGGRGCRFLVPTIIGEQESRGQHHLIQLSRLASSLNRTLDPAGFASLAGEGVGAFIEQGAFERWLEEGDEPHSARAVRLRVAGDPEPLGPTRGAFVPDRTLGGQPRAALCLDEARLAFGSREPLVAVEPAERDAASGELLENLRRLDERDDVEVLLVHWDLRAPLLGDESDDLLAAAFVYAPEWHALAGLVEALVGLKEGERAESALHSVYFATDYPLELLPGAPSHPTSAAEKEPLLEGGAPWLPAHSDTLSAKLTPSHHTAMTHFLSSFAIHAAPAGLTLNTYRSVLPSLLPSLPSTLATLAQTPAAPAIVSQLVLQRTRRFLVGEARPGIGRERCARRSSWTRRVVVARERAHEGGRGSGDVVGWWSTDGSIE